MGARADGARGDGTALDSALHAASVLTSRLPHSARGVAPQAQTASCASHLSSGAALASSLRAAASELRRAPRSATMMPLLSSSGVSAFDLEEALDSLEAAADDLGSFDDDFD